MIKFDKPNSLNGQQLIDELKAIGVIVDAETSPFIDGNGDFWLDIPESDKDKATPIVLSHNGITTIPPEPTVQEKLAKAGLTIDELKEALGL